MDFSMIMLLSVFLGLSVTIALQAYFGKDGIRANTRRKSWCRKMGYKLVKYFGQDMRFCYDYMGQDQDGNYHKIPKEIYPENHILIYPFC